jgi:hypothetical protein
MMGSKSKQTTDQTSHSVVTPTNPQWITDPVQSLAGSIAGLSKLDPYSLVAGPDALQTSAAQGLAGLAPDAGAYGSASNAFQGLMNTGASRMRAATGTASSLLPNINAYMSPYLNDVVNSSLADYDFGAGQTRAQNQLALANDDTFGGSGGAIQTALSNDAITRGRATLAAQLRDQGYQAGAGLANQDADRAQQMALANMAAQNQARQFNAQQAEAALARQRAAGEDLANTATMQNQAALSDAQAQAQLGEQLRQIQAAHNLAPISLLSSQTGLLNSLPLGLFHGEVQDGTSHGTSTTTTSNPLGAVTSLATGLGSLMGVPLSGSLGGWVINGMRGNGWGVPK